MNTHQMRCFLAVAKHLNYSRAAEELFISQPTLTYQISQLEKELGFPLFVRTSRKVILSEMGKAMQNDIKESLERIDKSLEKAKIISMQRSQEIILCHFDAMNDPLFVELLNHLKLKYPKYKFIVKNESRYKIIDAILNGEIDIAYVEYCLCRNQPVDYIIVKENPVYAILSKENPLAQKQSLNLEDLKNQIIMLESFAKQKLVCWYVNYFSNFPEYYTIVDYPDKDERMLHVSLNEGITLMDTKLLNCPENLVCLPLSEGEKSGLCLVQANDMFKPILKDIRREMFFFLKASQENK